MGKDKRMERWKKPAEGRRRQKTRKMTKLVLGELARKLRVVPDLVKQAIWKGHRIENVVTGGGR